MRASVLAALGLLSFANAHPQPGKAQTSSDGALCNVKGYDKGKPSAYDYSHGDGADWEANCVLKCALDSKCSSVAIGEEECLLYSSSLYEPSHYRGMSFANHRRLQIF